MSTISREELLLAIHTLAASDPSIVGEVITSLVSGLQNGVDRANKHAMDMETLFVMSALHGKLPTKQRDREYLATILERWAPQSRFNFAHTIKELRKP